MHVDLVFETHSTTDDNQNGIATGWNPGYLSSAGREQARRLGERRRDDGPSTIFTSDLERALERVRIAFVGIGVPVLKDWRLRECDYGLMNGTPAKALRREDHVDVPYPSGESWREAIARVLGNAETTLDQREGVLVVVDRSPLAGGLEICFGGHRICRSSR